MKLITQSSELVWVTPNALQIIESAGRTCYRSEGKITEDSHINFVTKLISRGHEAILEHASMSWRIICDRGISHEIVRHRIASFAQMSTRYCDEVGKMEFIIPDWLETNNGEYTIEWEDKYGICVSHPWYNTENDMIAKYGVGDYSGELRWFWSMALAERDYCRLRSEAKWSPQQARSVLPNSLRTEIVVTANIREWRKIFSLRCAESAHPQMQTIMNEIRRKSQDLIPVVFEDIKCE